MTESESQSVTIDEGPGPISRSVTEALKAVRTLPADVGAVALAEQYATLIDAAAPDARYTRFLNTLRRAVVASEDPLVKEAFLKIREALSVHSVTSDLGPKLLATLTSLGMTPAGRGQKTTKEGTHVAVPGVDALAQLRAKRARQHGA